MILRLILSICFISFVRAVEWQSHNYISGAPGSPFLTADNNAHGKPDFNMGANPFFNNNVHVTSKHGHLLEISQNTKCYTLKSMMKMVRGILGYLVEYPNKINYLHHLITFLKDENEESRGDYDLNKFGEIVRRIDIDESLPQQEKKVLRELLNVDPPKPKMQTKIVFNYELPSIHQPQCKDVFMKLMEVAHDSYIQYAKYPTCQMESNENYDSSNIDQPRYPNAGIQLPIDWVPGNDGNKPDKPELPANFADIIKIPHDVKPSENWPPLFPDDLSPSQIIEHTPKIVQLETSPAPPAIERWNEKFNYNDILNPLNGKVHMDQLIKYLVFILTQNNGNSHQNVEIIEKLIGLIKPNEHDLSYNQILALIETLQKKNVGQTNPKLIKIILPLLVNTKTAPDPKVFNILIRLLKTNQNSDVNPKLVELILAMLKLNKDDASKDKHQILLSLINPDETGEVNPKLIEIISSLLKVNQNSSPNNKIIQFLLTFLNFGKGFNPKNIDTLLYLLKLNNNHKLPEHLYQKIIQYLLKINLNKKATSMHNYHIYYPITQYPEKSHNLDGNLLAVLIAKNPHLFYKLLLNRYATMPNQFSPNIPGVIELTYLLKQPKPFVYQPLNYVKYRLPLPTFVTKLKNLLQKNPLLRSNPTKLYQDLITISNVTEISPNLQGYSKQDILKLTFANGALIKTSIMNEKNINFKEQIALVQNLNSDVQPESILEQSEHILNDQEFKYETTKLDQLWKMMHPESSDPPLPHVGNWQLAESPPQLKDSSFHANRMHLMPLIKQDIGQTNAVWSKSLLESTQEHRKGE